jgi:ATP-dependent helicase HrpB
VSLEAALSRVRSVLAENRLLVLTAEPGAGKTTLLPPALLDEPWLQGRKILLLEPRRVAARAAASRMAALRGEPPGQTIGWRMAQDTKVGPRTRLEVVTEGVLTRMLQNDPSLEGVGLVLFDEFHERSLNADLGLALSLDVRQLRPDLRLGLLSATMDVEAVKAVLPDAEAVSAVGRVFPVTTEHRASDEPLEAAAARAVIDGWSAVSGTLLVFLPGLGEIRRTAERVAGEAARRGESVLILHGGLSPDEQVAILEPSSRRRTVLATSVAETSVTIPDVELVIDSGWARFNRFDHRRGLDRLVTERVSRASADQRRGRAGRTGPGVCWRLWPAAEVLDPASEPEIVRADLSGAVLEAALWGVREPSQLTWMTVPPSGAWSAARELLSGLGALDVSGSVTESGRAVAGLGVEPRLGRLLQAAPVEDRPVAAACAAVLSDRDPLTSADPDLRLRLEPLVGGAQGMPWSRLREVARDLLSRLGASPSRPRPNWADAVGPLLAAAYPDRIAERLASGQYRLTNGRVLKARGIDSPWLVTAEADAGEATGTVRLAAPLTESEAETALIFQTVSRIEVEWAGWKPRVSRVRSAGAHVFERTGLRAADHASAIAEALRLRLEALDPETLPWTSSTRQLGYRLERLGHEAPTEWTWLADHADFSGGPVFDEAGFKNALENGLPWELRTRLDRETPETWTAPTGSRRRLVYGPEAVVLEVRIQEVFGLAETPRVAGGPVQLHLLSPAQRPLQITEDLAGFWKNTYPEVRKEMRGRYPRHYWPDNPLEAEPTARAKPSGT